MNMTNIIHIENGDDCNFPNYIDLNNFKIISSGEYNDYDIIFQNCSETYSWYYKNEVGKDITEDVICYRPKNCYISDSHRIVRLMGNVEQFKYTHPLLWEPKSADEYYYRERHGKVTMDRFKCIPEDYEQDLFGNCWKTEELAEKYGSLGVITPYLREIAMYNSNDDGSYWKPDWNDRDVSKYYGLYCHVENIYFMAYYNHTQEFNDLFYIKDANFKPSERALNAFKKHLGL